jgi:Uma2 family endonuclease
MNVMTAPQFLLPADRPLTVADLDLTPDDGQRYELDDGVLVVSPAPMFMREVVVVRLGARLQAACTPEFAVAAGAGVEVSEIQYWVPDLIVVRTSLVGARAKNVTRPPELAVEIASPSTARHDRNRKSHVYAEFGIPAYWIADPDPDQPSITAFTLSGSSYVETAHAVGEQRFVVSSPFGVEVVPAELVAGPWRRDQAVR